MTPEAIEGFFESIMKLDSLLGDTSKKDFLDQHLHKHPFSSVGTATSLRDFGSWDTVVHILDDESADVMVVRDGAQFAGPRPTTCDDAIRLSRDGYTILVRHAERHHDGLHQLAESFRADFRSPVDIHMYATPTGKHGFSWHYDAEDVFIFQTAGEKEYSLRKNTVNPWPLVETVPHNMRYEREITPLMRVLLKSGDWLYIPCGYWHKAEAPQAGETAISLALGVMSPAAIHLYDFLRTRFIQSLMWRQRLPVVTETEQRGVQDDSLDNSSHLEQIRQQLIADFTEAVQDTTTQAEFNRWLQVRSSSSDAVGSHLTTPGTGDQ